MPRGGAVCAGDGILRLPGGWEGRRGGGQDRWMWTGDTMGQGRYGPRWYLVSRQWGPRHPRRQPPGRSGAIGSYS